MTDARAPSSDIAWVDADKIRFRVVTAERHIMVIGEPSEPMVVTWSAPSKSDEWTSTDA